MESYTAVPPNRRSYSLHSLADGDVDDDDHDDDHDHDDDDDVNSLISVIIVTTNHI